MYLVTEYFALLMIVVLIFFFYEKETIQVNRVPLYRWCLFLPAFSISMDIICIAVEKTEYLPHWLHMLLNSAYFLFSALSCSVMAIFLVQKITEHVYEKKSIKRAICAIYICIVCFIFLLIVNWCTGCMFHIDQQGAYYRGACNRLAFVIIPAEMLIILLCYWKNRSSVGKTVAYALKMILGLTVVLVAVQVIFPQLLLNGILMAYVDLILFVHFQSQKIGYDTVTGIGNRKCFQDELTLRLKGQQQFQIVLVSPRDLSIVNKKYGLKLGDELLYSIAHALEHSGPDADVYRFSNVGFAVCFPYWTDEQVEQNLEHIQNVMSKKWQVSDITIGINFLIAELIHKEEQWSTIEVEDFLDYMMGCMKKEKIKRIRFNSDVEFSARHRSDMIRLLQKSIQEESFQVWYQPVYDLEQNSFVSAEALVRMTNENGQIIPPGNFIPLAEDIGVIEDISWIVLKKVCEFLKEQPLIFKETISVNMSMPQLLDQKFSSRVEKILEAYGVEKQKLRLEMTERVTLSNENYVQTMMSKVTQSGIAFFLDDFGVGYSNFISALQLPYECIKLDKSLMDGIEKSEKNRCIIQKITEIFHGIGCKVIAEGIETERQTRMMKEMQVDKIQGFYYAKPMTEEAIISFMKNQRKTA